MWAVLWPNPGVPLLEVLTINKPSEDTALSLQPYTYHSNHNRDSLVRSKALSSSTPPHTVYVLFSVRALDSVLFHSSRDSPVRSQLRALFHSSPHFSARDRMSGYSTMRSGQSVLHSAAVHRVLGTRLTGAR